MCPASAIAAGRGCLKVKAKAQKKGSVKRSTGLQGEGQAVNANFRRSRILTPVADGPMRTII